MFWEWPEDAQKCHRVCEAKRPMARPSRLYLEVDSTTCAQQWWQLAFSLAYRFSPGKRRPRIGIWPSVYQTQITDDFLVDLETNLCRQRAESALRLIVRCKRVRADIALLTANSDGLCTIQLTSPIASVECHMG